MLLALEVFHPPETFERANHLSFSCFSRLLGPLCVLACPFITVRCLFHKAGKIVCFTFFLFHRKHARNFNARLKLSNFLTEMTSFKTLLLTYLPTSMSGQHYYIFSKAERRAIPHESYVQLHLRKTEGIHCITASCFG